MSYLLMVHKQNVIWWTLFKASVKGGTPGVRERHAVPMRKSEQHPGKAVIQPQEGGLVLAL